MARIPLKQTHQFKIGVIIVNVHIGAQTQLRYTCNTHFAFTNYPIQDQILHDTLFATICGSYLSAQMHQSPAGHSQWGGVVYVRWPHTAKIKTTKISSEVSACISAKICTHENFLLYGMTVIMLHLCCLHVHVIVAQEAFLQHKRFDTGITAILC